jgi:type IV secretory pathway VirB2 component (pilin)
MQATRRMSRFSPAFNSTATLEERITPISPARTPPRPRYWGHRMRKTITVLEGSIITSLAIVAVVFMGHSAMLFSGIA